MRPHRVGEVLDAAIKIYIRNARTMMGLTAVVVIPMRVLAAKSSGPAERPKSCAVAARRTSVRSSFAPEVSKRGGGHVDRRVHRDR